MNRLPDFSAISRSQEERVQERVKLHVDEIEAAPVASGMLSCESQLASEGIVLLDGPCSEGVLNPVNWLLSETCEYFVEFVSLSADGCEAVFEISGSQELE